MEQMEYVNTRLQVPKQKHARLLVEKARTGKNIPEILIDLIDTLQMPEEVSIKLDLSHELHQDIVLALAHPKVKKQGVNSFLVELIERGLKSVQQELGESPVRRAGK